MSISFNLKEEDENLVINEIYLKDFLDFNKKSEMKNFAKKSFKEMNCNSCNSIRKNAYNITVNWSKTKVISEKERSGIFGGVKTSVIAEYYTLDYVDCHDGFMRKSVAICKSCKSKRKGNSAILQYKHPYLDVRTLYIDEDKCTSYLCSIGEDKTKTFCDTIIRPHLLKSEKFDNTVGSFGNKLWKQARNGNSASDALNGFAAISMILKKLNHENENPFSDYS